MASDTDLPPPFRGGLDPLLSSELRFYIVTVLAMYQTVDFNFLKQQLDATDGNLSANLTKLEEAGYLLAKKEFVGKKTRSTYTITNEGLAKLSAHLDTMEAVKARLAQEHRS
jgi:DNA-binding PadR family transcriptional regulator